MLKKIVNRVEIAQCVAQWRVKDNQIVFSNGCFDILHSGHLHTLQEAKKLGDKLIVGINSDDSVKRLKGDSRPINTERSRAELISSLDIVDAVVIFEEDTPLTLIELIKPEVLVKGGDWQVDEIVGGEIVKKLGGEVVSVPFVSNESSTKLIKKIQNL